MKYFGIKKILVGCVMLTALSVGTSCSHEEKNVLPDVTVAPVQDSAAKEKSVVTELGDNGAEVTDAVQDDVKNDAFENDKDDEKIIAQDNDETENNDTEKIRYDEDLNPGNNTEETETPDDEDETADSDDAQLDDDETEDDYSEDDDHYPDYDEEEEDDDDIPYDDDEDDENFVNDGTEDNSYSDTVESNASSKDKTIDAQTIKKQLKKLSSSTDIPTVCIYTKNCAEVVSREDYVDCYVYTINCDKEYKLSGDEAGIRVRGNSTAYGGNVSQIRKNQVPYRIKFKTKTNMFGLNSDAKCKSCVLVKAESNLVKTEIALRLGRTIVREYCSDGLLVHAYLNGVYKGTYQLCEQNQVNKHRINIYETPENYKGTDTGYLVEIDNYGEKPCFWIDYGKNKTTDIAGRTKTFKTVCYSIKSDIYSDEQKQFIKNYVSNTFKILYEACEKKNYYFLDEDQKLVKAKKKQLNKTDSDGNPIDPAMIVAEKVINIDSVVDMYILHEIVKSYDVGEGSFYMYADFSPSSTDSRLTFTCPWDFEWAYAGSTSEYHAALFNTDSFAATYEERSNPWFIVLMKQDWFVERVKERWTELRKKPGKGKKNAISTAMDEVLEILETYKKDLGKSGSVSAAKSLVSWVEKRISFMDNEFLIKD